MLYSLPLAAYNYCLKPITNDKNNNVRIDFCLSELDHKAFSFGLFETGCIRSSNINNPGKITLVIKYLDCIK